MAGQEVGQAGQAGQVVDLAGQDDRVDREVGQGIDKMVEDEVGTEIDQEAGDTHGILTECLIIYPCELIYFLPNHVYYP